MKWLWVAIKASSGIIAAFGLALALLIVVRDTPPQGGPPPPLARAIVPAIFGLAGILWFAYAEWKLRQLDGRATRQYWRNVVIGVIVGLALTLGLLLIIRD